jgi:hypothetical protein
MEYCYKGCVIVVRYRIIDGIVKIGTAFVKWNNILKRKENNYDKI